MDSESPKTDIKFNRICRFISQYAALLMGCGVHTSRVVRNTKRIGKAYDISVTLSVVHKTIILYIKDDATGREKNEVLDLVSRPISFELNSALSALSWDILDNKLSLEESEKRYYDIISKPHINFLFVLLLVGFANASFCKLFGGDIISMLIVFTATLTGFYLKHWLQRNKINIYITVMASSFVAAACASTSLIFNTTSDIAIATSVLFLVPGVPLINGVIDIVEGYPITGFSRLTEAILIIGSIGIGLALMLLTIKNSLI